MMHPTAVHIRRAEEADAARLSELGARVFHDTFAATSPPSDLDVYLVSTFGVAKQASEFADPAVLTLLAEVDSRPVGYAQVRRRAAPPVVTGPEPVQLWRFYVDRAYHGGGVAQALMAAVYEAARAHGDQTLWLAVWQENRRAIAMTEARDPPDDRAPPAPPELPRRVRLYPAQWVGVPLLFALPLLALLGIFDERRAAVETSSAEPRLRIDYPARSRYDEINPFLISVENRAQHALHAVHVVLDPALVDGFTRLEFIPAASSANTIALPGLQPSETREVHVILQDERSWRRTGEIIATSGAHDTARVHLRTFVLP